MFPSAHPSGRRLRLRTQAARTALINDSRADITVTTTP